MVSDESMGIQRSRSARPLTRAGCLTLATMLVAIAGALGLSCTPTAQEPPHTAAPGIALATPNAGSGR